MASRYDRFVYQYTTDLGYLRGKAQQARYVLDGTTKRYTTPITSLFMARVLPTGSKPLGSSSGTRRLKCYVKENDTLLERTTHLPYSVLDTTLVNHIKEILALDFVVCGDYEGENPLEER